MKVFVALLGFCLFCAVFGAWREQYVANKTKSEGLRGEIPKFGYGSMRNGPACIYPLVTISNQGTPSIAENFRAKITIGKTVIPDVKSSALHSSFQFVLKDGPVAIKPSEMLYEKASTPIPQGGKVTGWLLFFFDGWTSDQLHEAGVNITVYFKDVSGRTYETAPFTDVGGSQSGSTLYIPGVEDPFLKWPDSTPTPGAKPPP